MTCYEKISLIISIFAVLISLYVFFKNKLYSKATIENTIFSQVNSALSNFYATQEESMVFKDSNDNLSNSVRDKHKSSIEGVLSAYNLAYKHYSSKIIKTKEFGELYSADIFEFLKDQSHAEILYSNPQKYKYLKMFYDNKKNII